MFAECRDAVEYLVGSLGIKFVGVDVLNFLIRSDVGRVTRSQMLCTG